MQVWRTLWDSHRSGPDWTFERAEAIAGYRKWVTNVRARMPESFHNAPIVSTICELGSVFNEFGRHTANDVLHLAAIWPLTPTWVICDDHRLSEHLLETMLTYSLRWSSPQYNALIAAECNSNNPMAFHYNADDTFLSRFLEVYRKQTAKLDSALYDLNEARGNFDPDHTIGALTSIPVVPRHIQLINVLLSIGDLYASVSTSASGTFSWRFRPVVGLLRNNKFIAYTVIVASLPASWDGPEFEMVSSILGCHMILLLNDASV